MSTETGQGNKNHFKVYSKYSYFYGNLFKNIIKYSVFSFQSLPLFSPSVCLGQALNMAHPFM